MDRIASEIIKTCICGVFAGLALFFKPALGIALGLLCVQSIRCIDKESRIHDLEDIIEKNHKR